MVADLHKPVGNIFCGNSIDVLIHVVIEVVPVAMPVLSISLREEVPPDKASDLRSDLYRFDLANVAFPLLGRFRALAFP